MTKIYEYSDRVIIELNNKKRVNYNRKKYGLLLNDIVSLTVKKQCKIYNYYQELENNTIVLYYWNQQLSSIQSIFIDKEDFGKVKNQYWSIAANQHVFSRGKGRKTWLHHLILNVENNNDFQNDAGIMVDHINRNPLDNRKENLRIVCSQINQWNINKRNNVGITKRGNQWRVSGSRILHQEQYVNTFQDAKKVRKNFEQEFTKYITQLNQKVKSSTTSSNT